MTYCTFDYHYTQGLKRSKYDLRHGDFIFVEPFCQYSQLYVVLACLVFCMFPFSVQKSFVISNYTNKAEFAETLVNALLPKLHQPNVAIINNGYEIVLAKGLPKY
jgi:hypothetical protein